MPGALTLMYTLHAAGLSVLNDTYWAIGVAALTGLIADILLSMLRPSTTRRIALVGRDRVYCWSNRTPAAPAGSSARRGLATKKIRMHPEVAPAVPPGVGTGRRRSRRRVRLRGRMPAAQTRHQSVAAPERRYRSVICTQSWLELYCPV